MSDQVFPNYIDVTIANGQTDSDWIALKGRQLVAVVFPATLTGTSLKFLGRVDGGNGNLIAQKNSSTDYSTTFAASEWVPIDLDVFCGVADLKLRSSTSEGGARTIRLITRPLS